MPRPLVADFLTKGLLVRLSIKDDPESGAGAVTIYAAHLRDRPLGRAGGWLLDDLLACLA